LFQSWDSIHIICAITQVVKYPITGDIINDPNKGLPNNIKIKKIIMDSNVPSLNTNSPSVIFFMLIRFSSFHYIYRLIILLILYGVKPSFKISGKKNVSGLLVCELRFSELSGDVCCEVG
jgi:hypothetical protein